MGWLIIIRHPFFKEKNYMKRTNCINDCREIFSLRLAKYLENLGFAIITTRPDKKNTGRNVFIFANTPQLRQAIDTYMN